MRSPSASEKPMKPIVFRPRFFMSATMPLASSGCGCGICTTQGPLTPAGGGAIGETATIGVCNSTAALAMAKVCGAPDVPIRKSTFSRSTSLRTFCVVVAGSEASSSWISLIFSPPTLSCHATPAAIA